MLRVVAAAIKRGSTIWTLPPPNRHPNIMYQIEDVGLRHGRFGDQGFILSDGRFARRRRARRIAVRAGQVPAIGPHGTLLFSEDLW